MINGMWPESILKIILKRYYERRNLIMAIPYSKQQSTISAKTYREVYLSQVKKKNKFNAKTSTYKDKKYDSKLECKYAQELDFRIDAGEVIKWEKQVKLDLTVNGVHICFYYCEL